MGVGRPKAEDRLDEEMSEKTASEASIGEGPGERADVSAGEDLERAGERFSEWYADARDDGVVAARDSLEDATDAMHSAPPVLSDFEYYEWTPAGSSARADRAIEVVTVTVEYVDGSVRNPDAVSASRRRRTYLLKRSDERLLKKIRPVPVI